MDQPWQLCRDLLDVRGAHLRAQLIRVLLQCCQRAGCDVRIGPEVIDVQRLADRVDETVELVLAQLVKVRLPVEVGHRHGQGAGQRAHH